MEDSQSKQLHQRSTQEVFEDHLRLRSEHNLEEDIRRNYAATVTIMTELGKFYGHDGIRHTASQLQLYLPDGTYHFEKKDVEGEVAFEIWNGTSPDGYVHHGVDTFVIRDGKILYQTIHYEVLGKDRASKQ